MVSWVFLVVSIWGAWFTINAYRPARRQSPLSFPSFMAGWFTSELAVHHVVWQAIATVVFVALGALDHWAGWLALGITFASWIGLTVVAVRARRSDLLAEEALDEVLGDEWREILASGEHAIAPVSEPHRLALPFLVKRSDVAVVKNLRYADGAGRRHLLDVYHPRRDVEHAPVLLQVHGGGWVVGSKKQQAQPLMQHLASQGWLCVAQNYRLSPKGTFPDHIVDVKSAIAWIRANIAEYGGDPDFVAITGGSAGGHLSALAALTPNDPVYQPGFEDVDTRVQAAVPFYGIYSFTNAFGLGRGDDGMGGFLEKVVFKRTVRDDREAFLHASPIEQVRPDAPPFFVIHGTNDSLAPVEGARQFSTRLGEVSRAPVVYLELPGAQHAFEMFHSPRTARVVRAVERFLDWTHGRYEEGRAGLPAAEA